MNLFTRADDAGSPQAANRAIYECITKGIIRSISVMVPTPATAHAAWLLKDLEDTCFGFHVTLNAEWEGLKWKPLSPPERVPSLIDNGGYFLPHPKNLQNRVNIAEVLLETKTQLACLQELGFKIRYLDEHMAVGWIGLREALLEFARNENLIPTETLPYLPTVKPSGDLLKDLETRLELAGEGSFLYVTHPAFADKALELCFNHEVPKGHIVQERNAEREFLCSVATKQCLEARGVQLKRFDEQTLLT
jgi:chitin disaccharide deacetylase